VFVVSLAPQKQTEEVKREETVPKIQSEGNHLITTQTQTQTVLVKLSLLLLFHFLIPSFYKRRDKNPGKGAHLLFLSSTSFCY
jgi:hypothetical protein